MIEQASLEHNGLFCFNLYNGNAGTARCENNTMENHDMAQQCMSAAADLVLGQPLPNGTCLLWSQVQWYIFLQQDQVQKTFHTLIARMCTIYCSRRANADTNA